jgi:broad specificity phosphatase PhoE
MEGIGNNFEANVVRHGETKYEKGDEQVSVEEAEDLTEEGEKQMKETALSLADQIDDSEAVRVWSSPTARTLHSAKIISDVLRKEGKNIEVEPGGNEYGVRPFEQFGEVENLDFELFEPLITGGTVEFAGRTFSIDKNETNPKNLDYPEYFIKDAAHEIPDEVKNDWPKAYVNQIESFEKFNEVTNRIIRNLERASKAEDKDYRIIIVTHDALTMFLADTFTGGEKQNLDKSEFISLTRKEDGLYTEEVGDFSGEAKKLEN